MKHICNCQMQAAAQLGKTLSCFPLSKLFCTKRKQWKFRPVQNRCLTLCSSYSGSGMWNELASPLWPKNL